MMDARLQMTKAHLKFTINIFYLPNIEQNGLDTS